MLSAAGVGSCSSAVCMLLNWELCMLQLVASWCVQALVCLGFRVGAVWEYL
jgi:hypothetical protein